MGICQMNRAVFLDRDGVINRLVFNPLTGDYESPHYPEDLELYPWTIEALKKLQKNGYMLFLVSNQPSFAKGKTTLEHIKSIHDKFHNYISDRGITFTAYYYCYHHPHGIIPEFTCTCECRKPSPYFLLKAQEEFRLDMENSWFTGDRDTDIFCGQAAGVKTILIEEEHSGNNRGKSNPAFFAKDLREAVEIILRKNYE
ncbi:MAG: HAD family hydrolase [Candidatus Eremiobacterota bacterium]